MFRLGECSVVAAEVVLSFFILLWQQGSIASASRPVAPFLPVPLEVSGGLQTTRAGPARPFVKKGSPPAFTLLTDGTARTTISSGRTETSVGHAEPRKLCERSVRRRFAAGFRETGRASASDSQSTTSSGSGRGSLEGSLSFGEDTTAHTIDSRSSRNGRVAGERFNPDVSEGAPLDGNAVVEASVSTQLAHLQLLDRPEDESGEVTTTGASGDGANKRQSTPSHTGAGNTFVSPGFAAQPGLQLSDSQVSDSGTASLMLMPEGTTGFAGVRDDYRSTVGKKLTQSAHRLSFEGSLCSTSANDGRVGPSAATLMKRTTSPVFCRSKHIRGALARRKADSEADRIISGAAERATRARDGLVDERSHATAGKTSRSPEYFGSLQTRSDETSSSFQLPPGSVSRLHVRALDSQAVSIQELVEVRRAVSDAVEEQTVPFVEVPTMEQTAATRRAIRRFLVTLPQFDSSPSASPPCSGTSRDHPLPPVPSDAFSRVESIARQPQNHFSHSINAFSEQGAEDVLGSASPSLAEHSLHIYESIALPRPRWRRWPREALSFLRTTMTRFRRRSGASAGEPQRDDFPQSFAPRENVLPTYLDSLVSALSASALTNEPSFLFFTPEEKGEFLHRVLGNPPAYEEVPANDYRLTHSAPPYTQYAQRSDNDPSFPS